MPDNILKTIQKLVFAIEDNEHLGIIIRAFIVELTKNEQFTYNFRHVSHKTISDYHVTVSQAENELLTLLFQYNDDILVKKFSKIKKKVTEFYTGLSKEEFQKFVRPYIEKIISKSLSLIINNNIELYFKGKRTYPIPDKPVSIISKAADVVFNFSRMPDETHYSQTIRLQDKEINLTNKNAKLLCSSPCWLLLENKLLCFHEMIDGSKLLPFFTKNHIVIPRNTEKKYFQTFVLNSIKNFNIRAEGFKLIDELHEIQSILSLEINFLNEPLLSLRFKYGNNVVYHKTEPVFVRFEVKDDNYFFYKTKRDLAFEENKKKFLEDTGLRRYNLFDFVINDDSSEKKPSLINYISWINEKLELYTKHGYEVDLGKLNGKYHLGKPKKKLLINENQDWFDIEINVKFGDFEVPFVNLRHHIINNIAEFILPSGEIAIIPEEWFSKMKNIAKFGTESKKGISVKKYHFGLLEDMSDVAQPALVNEVKNFFSKEDYSLSYLSESMLHILRNYQKKGVAWMDFLQKNNWGGILADDMGLGKTIQAIAQIQSIINNPSKYRSNNEIIDSTHQLGLFDSIKDSTVAPQRHLPSIIIMPLSLVHNWEREFNKFLPEIKVYKHLGVNRTADPLLFSRYDIILTTYGTVRNDIDMISNFTFLYMILDESQQIKNPYSKNYAAVKQIKSLHKLILSGTPIENNLSDLWSQFSIINPGLLGSFSFFKSEFAVPIEKNNDVKSRETLKSMIYPFILRRTKDEVAKELPPLTEKYHYCEMTEAQRSVYEIRKSEIRNLMFEKIEKTGLQNSKFVILSGLMKLRLLANHPCLTIKDYHNDSGKFHEVIRNLEKLKTENHKVLIFSQFVKHLKLFKHYFDSVYYPYSFLTGETDHKSRISEIDNFHNNANNQFFLISLKAGGFGLNLTAADYVFMLDPWWNPSVEMQAINRAHRIGQDKKVLAYKFISTDTIEEKIILLQQKKQKLVKDFINNNNPFGSITKDELNYLFI